jgi:hypothetical protein
MANADPNSPAEARRLLQEFLGQVEKLLQDLVDNPRPVIPGRHHESMRDAWKDVQPKFGAAISALTNPTDPGTIEEALRARGLTGAQLIFKLNVFRHALENLLDHGTAKDVKDGLVQPRERRWWVRFLRWYTGALKAADVILHSLAGVPVVGVFTESISEFKEAVDSGADLGEAVD